MWRVAGLAVVLALTACSTPDGPPSPSASTPSPTAAGPSSPGIDLRAPGLAAQAIGQLVAAAGTDQAIRLRVDQSTASLTYVDDEQAVTLGWDNGRIATLDSDINYVGQTGFAVSSFNLDDIGQMFAQAAQLAGSDTDQELQINEYNAGRVLMTVTTSPESQTIFFRPDASLINWLDFTNTDDVAEALADVAGDGVQVIALGVGDMGFFADVRVNASIIERRTRPAKLPAYSAQRSASSDLLSFNPSDIDPAVIARLLADVPAALDKADARASLAIDTRDDLGAPVIRVSVGLTTRAFTLDGSDITDQLP